MTAEIAIMNKQAIALAADSAATLKTPAGPKILTADKIFALSKYHPVGVMVYGSAEFVGMPWETIVKGFRESLGDEELDSIADYRKRFTDHLVAQQGLFPEDQQDLGFEYLVHHAFSDLMESYDRELQQRIATGRSMNVTTRGRILSRIVADFRSAQLAAPKLPDLPTGYRGRIEAKFGARVDELRQHIFPSDAVSATTSKRLHAIGIDLAVRQPSLGGSGLVFAGFGRASVFPELQALELEGLVEGSLIASAPSSWDITHNNSAWVVPFAQKEMVATFMEGVDPDYRAVSEAAFESLLEGYGVEIARFLRLSGPSRKSLLKNLDGVRQNAVSQLSTDLRDHRRMTQSLPVMNIVSALPKDELAEMAESLVNLTSFKRRVSTQVETVGGPIDVCVISKNDGFIWIKRKHYFEQDLNPHFLANYYR